MQHIQLHNIQSTQTLEGGGCLLKTGEGVWLSSVNPDPIENKIISFYTIQDGVAATILINPLAAAGLSQSFEVGCFIVGVCG